MTYIIHNGGTAPGGDFNVNVYMRQPISSSIATENCGAPAGEVGILPLSLPKLLETTHVDEILPGQSQYGTAQLFTDSTEPLEIKVDIESIGGESDVTNNIAYETFAHFYGSTMSAVEVPYLGGMSMSASDKCLVGIPFEAIEVPDENGKQCVSWDFNIEPSSGRMQPGETINFNVFGAPKPGEKPGTACRSKFCVLMPLTSFLTPVQCFNFEARVVDPSSISCSAPGGSSAPDEPVTITGKLEPGLSDVVSLTYTNPAGEQETKTVLSAANGVYQDDFTPGLTGNWSVEALWSGDDSHAPTYSSPCQFTVEKKVEVVVEPPLFKAVKRANCREGNSVLWRTLGLTQVGAEYPIVGAVTGSSWFYVQLDATQECWVKADTGETSGDLSGIETLTVRVITPTPTLVPTFTPTPAEVDICESFNSEDFCNRTYPDLCRWSADKHRCERIP